MAGDIAVVELTLGIRASVVDMKGIRLSTVEEGEICVTDLEAVITVIELVPAMLGDTVSSGMSISLVSPDPDPGSREFV